MAMRKKTRLQMKVSREKVRNYVKEATTQGNQPEDGRYIHYGAYRPNADVPLTIQRIGDPANEGTEYLERFEAFRSQYEDIAKTSTPQDGMYFNMFRMWEDGKVHPAMRLVPKDDNDATSVANIDKFNKTNDDATIAVAEYFDTEFPQYADAVKDLIDTSVQKINEVNSIVNTMPAEDRGFSEDDMTSFLEFAVKQQEKRFLEHGSIKPLVGWLLQNGNPLLRPFILDIPKYRFTRAVSQIAAQTNSPGVVMIVEGWEQDKDTLKRTGIECINGSVIRPDGTVAVDVNGRYDRRNGRTKILSPIQTPATHTAKQQRLFPAWSYTPVAA
jgi:hypothetical protein